MIYADTSTVVPTITFAQRVNTYSKNKFIECIQLFDNEFWESFLFNRKKPISDSVNKPKTLTNE
ncbi:MAG: urate oxidase-like protein [Mastigocladus sp. ERB_26_2]